MGISITVPVMEREGMEYCRICLMRWRTLGVEWMATVCWGDWDIVRWEGNRRDRAVFKPASRLIENGAELEQYTHIHEPSE